MNYSDKRHIAPKKSLGQNFLVDKNIIRKIVDSIGMIPGDSVVEIGPGEGALTTLIAEHPIGSLLAIEYDARAVQLLSSKLPQARYPHFALHHGDVRAFPLSDYAQEHWHRTNQKLKIVGNIPYNITSDILFWLYDAAPHIERAIIMMQKEVAHRLTAQQRTKDYGILTIATSFAARARVLFDVSPGCFFPRPNVTSSVVELLFHPEPPQHNYSRLRPLVNAAFGQRRKVLSNALRTHIALRTQAPIAEIVQKAESQGILYFRSRAEELSPADFVRLQEFIDSL